MAGWCREVIAELSHDLCTPLTNLRGYLRTLEEKDGELSDELRRRFLGIALRQSERLESLVFDLIELTRLEEGVLKPCPQTLSLAELVRVQVESFQLTAEERGLDLVLDVAAEPGLVAADRGLLERVLENLLSNALYFTPPPGRVRVSVRETPGNVEVAIADTGCGIPADELPHIFDRYYRGRCGQAAPGTRGAGLGLAIAQRILFLHQSAIRVASRPGQGTTFCFSLPHSRP